jgi:hypothetical protein
MGGACDSVGGKRNGYCLAVNPIGRGQLVRLGEKVILKCILRSDWGVWTGVRWVSLGLVV